uniref:Uncharacterized protein n=1 Tax=Nicotiana tabacum TaxID=4097 RepID=A0A1S4BD03_TOBAC|nr:PREDICTED: uncharacterized protein LOC107806952 [Nicotiana tabacum]
MRQKQLAIVVIMDQQRLATKKSRDPTPSELHLHVHTHGNDGRSFVGEKSQIVHEKYQEISQQQTQTQSDIDQSTPPYAQSTPTGNLDELVMRLIPALTDHIVPVIVERVCELVSLPSHQPNTDLTNHPSDMAPTVPTSSTAANVDEVYALGSDNDRNSPASHS